MPRLLLAALLMVVAPAALAHEFQHGALRIEHPFSFPGSGPIGAGYMTLINEGSEPVALIGARSPAAQRVELHTTELDGAGVARMVEQARIEIAPGATVTFEPGGLHVMFMGLAQPLAEGDRVPAELLFEDGAVAVVFEVEPRRGGAHGHTHTHGHGARN